MMKEVYSQIIKSLIIDEIFVKELKSERYDFDELNGINLEVETNHQHKLESMDDESFNVLFKSEVQALSDKKENIFDMEIIHCIRYKYSLDGKFDSKVVSEAIEEFMRRNVPVNVWPYIRESIGNTSMRMGFPSLLIQPLKRY